MTLYTPLASQLRPTSLNDIMGQPHLLANNGTIHQFIAQKALPSIILWGPPGCGKTTLAQLLGQHFEMEYVQISAVRSGVNDLKKIFDQAEKRQENGGHTLLFVDEIHRYNRAQQDIFLPLLEAGTLTLIGATTENPSFELNKALLSRCQVLTLEPLGADDLGRLIERALQHLGTLPALEEEMQGFLIENAQGDARYLLNMMEQLSYIKTRPLTLEIMAQHLNKRAALHDKHQEQHYNLMSAYHKALRGSDVQAALYWLGRMLTGGEDPYYILRRMIRFASEDIGLADPNALPQALAARQAFDVLGPPEGNLALYQACIYLATAPKSNRAYVAQKAADKLAAATSHLGPPLHIRNAPTSLMKELGYGAGYQYDPDAKDGIADQNYFPEGLEPQDLYTPVARGFEREIEKRMAYYARKKQET